MKTEKLPLKGKKKTYLDINESEFVKLSSNPAESPITVFLEQAHSST